jgi:hypothetical protein
MYINNCNLDKMDVHEIDPDNDIYLCRNIGCKSYHKYNNESIIDIFCPEKYTPLDNAIYYIRLKRLKKLFEKMSREEIINYKYNYRRNISCNILEQIVTYLMSTTFPKFNEKVIPSFEFVSCFTLNGHYGRNPMSKISNDLAIKLIKYLCLTYPELITEKSIHEVDLFNCNIIADILKSHYIKNTVSSNVSSNVSNNEPICNIYVENVVI